MSTQGTQDARYSILIEWSDEDGVYVVTLPEWGVHTHGATYEEALRMGRELLGELIAMRQEEGKPPPAPRTFAGASA